MLNDSIDNFLNKRRKEVNKRKTRVIEKKTPSMEDNINLFTIRETGYIKLKGL